MSPPTQGSQLDAKEAGKAIKLIKQQERAFNRTIPYAILYTRTSSAIRPRTLAHIQQEFKKYGVRAFEVHIHEREAYRVLSMVQQTMDAAGAQTFAPLRNALDRLKNCIIHYYSS